MGLWGAGNVLLIWVVVTWCWLYNNVKAVYFMSTFLYFNNKKNLKKSQLTTVRDLNSDLPITV